MTINNGSTPDANDVRGLFRIFTDNLTSVTEIGSDTIPNWKSKFASDTNLIKLENTDWATTTTGMSTDTTEGNYYKDDNATFTLTSFNMPLLGSGSYVTVIPNYEIYKLYDECDDSSVNGTNWVKIGTATASEDTSKIRFPANSEYRTSNLSAEKLITFSFNIAAENDGESIIKFYDGTNSITILDLVSSSGSSYNSYARGVITIRLDFTNKKAWVNYRYSGGKTNDTVNMNTQQYNYTSYVDLSSLSTNLYLDFSSTNHATSYIDIYYLRLGKSSPSTTITNSYSRDAGSNYTAMTNRFATSTGSGSTITVKSTGTVASNEVLAFKGWTIFEELQ